MCLILVEPSVSFTVLSQKFKTHRGSFPHSQQLPSKYLLSSQSAGARLTLDWSKKEGTHALSCLWLCVWGKILGHFDSLWWVMVGRRPWDHARWTSFFSQTVALSALVIMAVLLHSHIYLVQPQTEKVGVWWRTCQAVNRALCRPVDLRESTQWTGANRRSHFTQQTSDSLEWMCCFFSPCILGCCVQCCKSNGTLSFSRNLICWIDVLKCC